MPLLPLALVIMLADASAAPGPTDVCRHEAFVSTPVKPFIAGLPQNVLDEGGTAEVQVIVEPDGSPKSPSTGPAGFLALDMASLASCAASKYEPKMVDCKPVEGTYIFRFDLPTGSSPWQALNANVIIDTVQCSVHAFPTA